MHRQMGPFLQQVTTACTKCEGSGESVSPKDRCKVCNGKLRYGEMRACVPHCASL
jgi:DnaJ family protein A protein 2